MEYGTAGQRRMSLDLSRANRHGLVAGATGTGKTVTLQTLAEGFARNGVAVFAADIKGDLSGIASSNKTIFWDVFGERGHQLRTTIKSIGPVLMARMLRLTRVQEGVLSVAFAVARDIGVELTTITSLRHVLQYMGKNASTVSVKYGNVTSGSIGAIQRQLTVLLEQGAAGFFGHPPFGMEHMLVPGQISMLDATRLIHQPLLYSAFMIWFLEELYRTLPEVGDASKPKLVVFVDEAHLLFADDDRLTESVERVVRLIRSKGVGVYFVTQSPIDVPDPILAQLGNRFQHALRAYTPRDLRAVRAAASTFRANNLFDTAATLQRLPIGSALVSTLNGNGEPGIVERVKIDLPKSRLGPATEAERTRSTLMQAMPTPDDDYRIPDDLPGKAKPPGPLMFIGVVLAIMTVLPVIGLLASCVMLLAKAGHTG